MYQKRSETRNTHVSQCPILAYEARLRKAFKRHHIAADQLEELCMHVEESYEAKRRAGLSASDAAASVIEEVGDIKLLSRAYTRAKWYSRFCFWKSHPMRSTAVLGIFLMGISFFGIEVRENTQRLAQLTAALGQSVYLDADVSRSPIHLLKIAKEYEELMRRHNRPEYGDRDKVSFISFHKDRQPTVTLCGQESRIVYNPDGTETLMIRGKDGIYRPDRKYMELVIDTRPIALEETETVSGTFYTVYPYESYNTYAQFGTLSNLSSPRFYKTINGQKWYLMTFDYTLTADERKAIPKQLKKDILDIRILHSERNDLGCYSTGGAYYVSV